MHKGTMFVMSPVPSSAAWQLVSMSRMTPAGRGPQSGAQAKKPDVMPAPARARRLPPSARPSPARSTRLPWATPRSKAARPPRSPSWSSRSSSARSAPGRPDHEADPRDLQGRRRRSPSSTCRCPSTTTPRTPPSPPWRRSEQGKFWELHDKMFANQQALDRPSLEKYAQELGLDMAKFKAAIDNPKLKERVEADKKQAAQFGATGTPTFFVNGRKMVGAQAFDAFKPVIDEEIKKADDKLKAGVTRAELYAALTKDGLEKAAAPAARPAGPAGEPTRTPSSRPTIAGAPGQGRQGRAGHHRGVLRVPVPLLCAGRADHGQGDGGVPGQGPRGLARLPPALPPERHPGRHRGPGRGRAGQVLGDARQAVREPARAGPGQPGAVRPGAGPERRQGEGRARRQEVRKRDQGRHGDGPEDWRARHAGLLHQRHLPVGRPALRERSRPDRQQLAKAEALVKKGVAQGQGLRRDHEGRRRGGRRGARRPGRRPRRPGPSRRPRPTRPCSRSTRASRPRGAPRTLPSPGDLFSDFQCPFCIAGRALHHPAGEGVPRQDPGGLEGLPARLSPERPPGGDRRPRGRGRGQVLADARQAVREPARARSAQPGEIRPGAGARHGQVPGRARQRQVLPRDRRRHEGRADAGRAGDAGGVHQRPQDRRRLPLRDLQEGRRAGAGQAKKRRKRSP